MSSKSRPLYKTIFIAIVATVFTLYLLIWTLSSTVIKHFAAEPLAEMGLILSESSQITFNPFLTRVTITDLLLTKENKTVLSAKALTLQLALHKLLSDKVLIEEFLINGIDIEIEKNADKIMVAGVQIAPPVESKENSDAKEPQPETTHKEPLPYQILLDALVLTNSNVNILLDGHSHKFTINKLKVSDIQATELEQIAAIDMQSLIDDAPLNITANVLLNNGNGTIKSSTEISKYPLTKILHLIKPLHELDGNVSFSSEQKLTIADKKLTVKVANAELSNQDLFVNTNQNTINLGNAKLTAANFSLSLNDNSLNQLSGIAQLALEELNVTGENKKEQILAFNQLNITNIAPLLTIKDGEKNTQNQLPTATVETVVVNDLLFSQRNASNLPALAKIKKITVDNIRGASDSVTINAIDIDSITSHVILDKDKAIATLVALAPQENTSGDTSQKNNEPTTTSADSSKAANSKPFYITLNAFNIINNNQINFVDNSVNPVYERSLMIDELSVGTLSNTNTLKENKTPVKLIGRSNEYANFAFDGFIKPFAQHQTYHVKGQLKELSLPAVSTYMKDALELELTSGQLNTNIDVTLVDDDIDGEVAFNIKGLETGAADSYETNTVKDQVGIPLNAALGMLKDSNGNLELDIPLSGKTSDPSFGVSNFIALITKKAVMSATESYIMKTFVPYANVVSVAMVAGEFILKVRFEDLPYQPKQIELDEKQSQYLSQFVALMKDKKDTQVKICAISTPSDIDLPFYSKLTEAQIKQLKQIGDQREKHFKSQAVNSGIASGRILLCTPQIDNSKDGIPRINISV